MFVHFHWDWKIGIDVSKLLTHKKLTIQVVVGHRAL